MFLKPTYVNPLVAVKFNLIKQKTAQIECRVVAKNIAYENYYDPFEGKVIFNLTSMS